MSFRLAARASKRSPEAYAVSPANVVPKDMLSLSLESMAPSVLSLVSLVVVAHYLSPQEFGVATVALAIVQLCTVPIERVFHDGLVTRRELDSTQVNTAFTMSLLLSVGLCAGCHLLADVLEKFWHQALLGNVLRWMSLSLLGTGIGSVLAALLRRKREFRALALCSLGGSVGSTAIVIAVVVQGGGVYSLVTQQVSLVFLSTLTLWLLPHERPRLRLNPDAARALIGFGSLPRSRLATNLLVPRVFIVLVGWLLGYGSAGILGLAFRTVDTLRDLLVGALARVRLPRNRVIKPTDAPAARAYSYGTRERQIRLTALAAFPIFTGIALSADDLVPIAFGAQWSTAAPYVSAISLLALPLFLRPLSDLMLEARNEPHRQYAAMLELVAETAIIVVGMLLVGRNSLWLALLVWTARLFVSLPLDLWGVQRNTGVSYTRQLKSVVTPAVATIGMACVVLAVRAVLPEGSRAYRIAIILPLELMSYGVCVALFDREVVREVLSMLQSRRT
jgi:O-antigen/teichoic acid export membrane protein